MITNVRRIVTLSVCCVLLIGVTVNGVCASTIPLSDLVNGQTIMSGDKLFENFTYTATEDMPSADAVNVITIQDGNGYYGIRFQGGFLDLPGGSPSDALITYDVTATGPGMLISDVHLVANTALVGPPGAPGLATVVETFAPQFNNTVLTVYDNGTSKLVDWADLPRPVKTLSVQKDILLRAADDGVSATVSFVDQTFSQIPEPTSMVLLVMGLVGLAIRRR